MRNRNERKRRLDYGLQDAARSLGENRLKKNRHG